MKRKLIYAIALSLICYAYYYSIKNYRSVEKRPVVYKEFGISEQLNIFVNNMEPGRYTSHGRLIDDK